MEPDVRQASAPSGEPARLREAPRHAAAQLPAQDEVPLDLLEATQLLRSELAALRLPLGVAEAEMGRRERDQLLSQLDDYLLPRLRRMDAPVLAVVGGSTGAGKSTLVNSLLRREVTRSGVLRPTTRSPVLVHHPYDSGAFLSQRILPGLARVTSEAPEPAQPIDVDAPKPTALRLVPHEGMPPGIAIVDAPDIDSLVDSNRELAYQLLAAADLWIFVTTAARYSDAVPWQEVRNAVERGVSVAVVLDRVPPAVLHQVRTHLATMLRDRGLATSPLFTITEAPRSAEGFLPRESVQPLVAWLTRLARDTRSRDVVIRRTLVGALDSLRDRIPVIAAAADDQVAADERLRDDLDEVYAVAVERAERRLCDGTLMRGEVLARWQESVGTGDIFRGLDAAAMRVSDRLGGSDNGPGTPTSQLEIAVRTGLEALIRSEAQQAADQAIARWRARDEGAGLLDSEAGSEILGQRVSPEFVVRLGRAVDEWFERTVELAGSEGGSRRPGNRASLGAEASALVAMLSVFSADAADGSDREAAAGTFAVTERLLDAAYGEQAAASLIAKVRSDLVSRITSVLDIERSRIEGLLDDVEVRDGRGEMLRALATAVEEAR